MTGTGPQYLAEFVKIYIHSRPLHSFFNDVSFHIPTFKQYSGYAFFLYCANLKFSPYLQNQSKILPLPPVSFFSIVCMWDTVCTCTHNPECFIMAWVHYIVSFGH